MNNTKSTMGQENFPPKSDIISTTISPEVKHLPAPTPINANELINNASEIAKILTKVINNTKLYVMINGKKHVYVEGWETLGAMLHCTSEITLVKEYKNGYWSEAIIKNHNGTMLSKGIGICLKDEKNWNSRDEYAVMSMAQTRSIGKAYRLAFSWIMTIAGYDVCPAEEIPHIKETKITK